MNIFSVRERLIGDYQSYIRSFIRIRNDRIREKVTAELDSGTLWPQPLIQLNPAFEPGSTIDQLADAGVLHDDCRRIFRARKSETDPDGRQLRLHRHQEDAVRTARTDASYVLTTGTGSGKSLRYRHRRALPGSPRPAAGRPPGWRIPTTRRCGGGSPWRSTPRKNHETLARHRLQRRRSSLGTEDPAIDYLDREGRPFGPEARPGGNEARLVDCADAIDAVLCAFAAMAVTENRLACPVPEDEIAHTEGWIAVHDDC